MIQQFIFNRNCLSFFDSDKLLDILILAAKENNEEIPKYGVQEIIRHLQNRDYVDVHKLATVEYIYLIFLGKYERLLPKALPYILGSEPPQFCSFIEEVYRKHNQKKHGDGTKRNDREIQQAYRVLHSVHFIPGTDMSGQFHASDFEMWMNDVEKWAKENDRYEVTMITIGTNLAYAEVDQHGMPDPAIIKVLNKPGNNNLRNGYYSGIRNKRGAYWVDPEGKPEDELADAYEQKAIYAEEQGYARWAEMIHSIAESYRYEAEMNRKQHLVETTDNNE